MIKNYFQSYLSIYIYLYLYIYNPFKKKIIIVVAYKILSKDPTLCIDADGPLTCPIQEFIKEVMVVLTSAVMGANPMSLLSQGNVLRQRPIQIAISPSSHLRLRCPCAF